MKRFLSIIWCIVLMIILSTAAYPATVKISWNANTESDLAGYRLYYGTEPGAYGTPIVLGKVTSCTLTVNPTTTTTYYAALTAYDTSGNESAKSDEASITVTVADTTPPAKPTGLKALIQQLVSWCKGRFARG